MSEKILKGRSVQKHDTEANWLKATNFIPKQGEIIIYDIDETHSYERVKIGDGKTVVSSLPFIDDAMPHTIKETEIVNIARDEFVAKIGTTSFNKDLSSTGVVFDPNKRYVFEFMGERKLGNISEQNYVLATFGDISIQITDWWGLYLTIYGTITEYFTDLKIYELEIVELDNACLEKDVVIQNSISISRKGEIGGFSSALGFYTEASGEAAHAEGNQTKATGSNAHAEGRLTTASGGDSHVEGYNNVASGDRSHVEGSGNIASGEQAHAEGLSTLASSANQHVQGKYNIEDTTDVYAHIVGNGTSDSKRSNAHTLDWNGNAWFAGDVTVGADSKKLATEESVTAISGLVGDTAVSTQIETAIASKADTGHTHDDIYYTESEINTKLAGKSDTSHTHSAYVNQNAFSNVKVGSTTIAADAVTDTLTLVAGSNVTLTPDATNDKITIAATNTTYSDMKGATSSAAGTHGLVPAPAAGKQASFLRGDGTWAVPTDTNTVTTATTSGSGNAVTSVTASNGALTVTKGETFATKSQLDAVSGLVGDTAVATQISTAIGGHTHTVSHTPAGTVVSKYITPAGTVSQPTFTGSAVTSGEASAKTTVYSITDVGILPSHTYTAPSLTASCKNQCLTLTFSAGSHSFNAGTLPTKGSGVSVATGTHTHSVTAAGTVSQPTFTGTAASHDHTFNGTTADLTTSVGN